MLPIYFLMSSAPPGHRWLRWLSMPMRDNEWFWGGVAACGIVMFFSRWVVQWIYSEKLKESKVPALFWWQSLLGALLMLLYAMRQRDLWITLSYLFTFIPYSRNLVLMYRKRRTEGAVVPA